MTTIDERAVERITITRLSRDAKRAMATLGIAEARWLVDTYYQLQDNRIRANNQVREAGDAGEPHAALEWLADQFKAMEYDIKTGLGNYAMAQPVGPWLDSIYGIGPVISAGLLANLDIKRAPTAGHFWRICGLDPSSKWISASDAAAIVAKYKSPRSALTGEITMLQLAMIAGDANRRPETLLVDGKIPPRDKLAKKLSIPPWNHGLKRLCFLIGESFVKFQNQPDCFYGKIFAQWKADEWAANLAGKNAEQAGRDSQRYGKTTVAYKFMSGAYSPSQIRTFLEAGESIPVGLKPAEYGGIKMFCPLHIHQRARRKVVKLFLSHLHAVWYRLEYGTEPPVIYAVEHMGHRHTIEPPTAI